MTNEKARDFFSAYYEGTLEPGLTVSLEQRLKADEHLNEEYQTFVDTIDHLGTLKFEDIAIPADLNERIAARLDRHVYEAKRKAKPAWHVWLRGAALVGVGALAIAGAVFSFQNHDSVATAGFVPSVAGSDKITFARSGAGIEVHYTPASPKTIVVTDEQGKVLTDEKGAESRQPAGDAAHPEMVRLLVNDRPSATVFQLKGASDATGSYLAIPGKTRSTINAGEGTVVEFAKALADYFRVPVSLRVAKPEEHLTWTFATNNSVDEAGKALGNTFRVTLLQNDVLQIEQS